MSRSQGEAAGEAFLGGILGGLLGILLGGAIGMALFQPAPKNERLPITSSILGFFGSIIQMGAGLAGAALGGTAAAVAGSMAGAAITARRNELEPDDDPEFEADDEPTHPVADDSAEELARLKARVAELEHGTKPRAGRTRNDTEVPVELFGEFDCLQCGAPMPVSGHECPKCGWSYAGDESAT